MLRNSILVLALLAPAAANAATPAMQTGERDGVRFEYATELTPKGLVQISGRMLQSGEPFRLLVDKSGHVSGSFGPSTVEYDVAATKQAVIAASLTPTPGGAVAIADSVGLVAAAH